MKPTIWIFSLEPLESRYTAQWHKNIPILLTNAADGKFNIRQVDGVQRATKVTAGAFLNFSDTNYWKSSQLCNFIELLDAGETTPNDRFLFTDIWNPVITQVKYINDLMGYHWQLHSIAHAGAYDPSDILGYKMEKPWPWHAERSWFHSCESTYFATEFHKNMFLKNLNIEPEFHHKAIRSGQPHTPIIEQCSQYLDTPKLATMIWPHRYNDDKQPKIVEDIIDGIHGNTIITQQLDLSKEQYYKVLGNSRVMFSCSLHENLGISIMEGVLAGVIPVLPDRCSYSEMYRPVFKYPSEWTINYESYLKYKNELVDFINDRMDNPEKYEEDMRIQRSMLIGWYLNADVMIGRLLA